MWTPQLQKMGTANQSATPGRTTLVEAVNVMLQTIGEQPISMLEGQQVSEASMAERTLLELHKEGQVRGWSWNTSRARPFTVDTSGLLAVPANIVSWVPDPYQWAGRFQLRGSRVYDTVEHTFQIDQALSPIHADVVELLPWDDCPEAFNRWSTARAARAFAGRILGSDSDVRRAAIDEEAAQTELMRVEIAASAPNMLTGGPGGGPFPTFSAIGGLRHRLGGRIG